MPATETELRATESAVSVAVADSRQRRSPGPVFGNYA
jgi:hypothetical protein